MQELILTGVLVVALGYDLKQHRVPNILTASALLLGLGLHLSMQGLEGLLLSVAGCVTGLLLFLPFYIRQGMGAGDVKLIAAIGALVAVPNIFYVAAGTLVSGALVALFILLLRGGIAQYLGRYLQMMKTLAVCGQLVYLSPEAGSASVSRFPYVTAIAAGTVLMMSSTGMLTGLASISLRGMAQ
jgi:prepilin peptidase CpaA